MDLNRDQEIYQKISKTGYTKRSVNNQKAQKSVPVLERNLSVKNAPKLSAKYLQDKICNIKQMQNISVSMRTLLNQLKTFQNNLTLKWTPLTLQHLKF